MSSAYTAYAGSIQDRTVEFQQCVSSYDRLNKSKQRTYQPTVASNGNSKQPITRTEFTNKAKSIADDIAHVTSLLSKLALCKFESLPAII